MRGSLILSFATIAVAAPARLPEWGDAITSLGSWWGVGPNPHDGSVMRGADDRNIYDMLKDSHEYTRLMKWVDMNRDVVDKLKNDRDITFFAPNNDAMPRDEDMVPMFKHGGEGGHERGYKEFIREVMLYNILPEKFDKGDLARNSTFATELHAEDGSLGGRKRRIKVEGVLGLTINNGVRVTNTYYAKNGIVHAVDRPIYLPPDIMDALYLYPKMFSAASVAFVKTDLEKELEFNSRNSKNNKHRDQWPFPGRHGNSRGHSGYAATTVFVPSNEAFNRLPNDLVAYLFSPMGERTLRKLMEFHTIPDYVLYTEWIHHIKSDNEKQGRRRDYDTFSDEDFEIHLKEEFPTLTRQKLPVQIDKTRTDFFTSGEYEYNFKVHGILVVNKDNVAQNGAMHIIDTVLCPRHKGATDLERDERDWNEWQKWLLDWARDN